LILPVSVQSGSNLKSTSFPGAERMDTFFRPLSAAPSGRPVRSLPQTGPLSPAYSAAVQWDQPRAAEQKVI